MIMDWLKKRRTEPEKSLDIDELCKTHPAIRITNLTKTFKKRIAGAGTKEKKKVKTITAIDSLSISVERGSIYALLGPNSCGKTTTMRCMSTITEPDSGAIEYYGVDIVKRDDIVRNMFGYVMQSAGVDKMLTGREHLQYFAGLAHIYDEEMDKTVEHLIELLELEEFIDRLAGVYSGGVIRRLDLAIALLHKPPILILDEPTVGLDIESRKVIWDTLKHWKNNGGTVFFSSHYLEEVDILSDYVAIMDNGILIAQGTPMQLKDGLGGDRISIRLSEFTAPQEAEKVITKLKELGLVLDAIVNTSRCNAVELVVDAADASVGSRIVQALADMGHDRLFSFAQAKPSLDDVYLAATGKSLMDADITAKLTRNEKSLRKENMT